MQTLTFPATLDSLQPIRDFLVKVAADVGLDRSSTYNLCLAVDEIATNVVIHGYQEAGLSGNLKIGVDQQGDKLIVRLVDHGKAYDPNAHDMPTEEDLQLPLEERQIGGLGIFLAKTSVEDLQYTTSEAENIHRFVISLSNTSKGVV